MIQVLAKDENGEDVLEYTDGKIYLTVNTQYSMTDWFKKCLKRVFPNIIFGIKSEIPVELMSKVVDVYLYTR